MGIGPAGPAPAPAWLADLKPYEAPSTAKAVSQLADTILAYAALWATMILWLRYGLPFWGMIPILAAGSLFLVRIFVLFHDCCHGSFLPVSWGNRAVGYLAGVLTYTDFEQFRHSHGVHHSTAGNLDRRGTGDIWTMTVQEYRESPWWRRANYRAYRSPLVLFGLGPVLSFLVFNRFPRRGSSPRRTLNVLLTDLGIVLLGTAISLAWGWRTYVLIQAPILFLSGAMGIWLFYVQHQFDPSYWQRDGRWGFVEAAMDGSSYYRLPRLLQRLSGNIGLHHVHHLRPRIPNYNLQACLDAIPALRQRDPLTIRRSLGSMRLNLWDEERHKLVGFRAAP